MCCVTAALVTLVYIWCVLLGPKLTDMTPAASLPGRPEAPRPKTGIPTTAPAHSHEHTHSQPSHQITDRLAGSVDLRVSACVSVCVYDGGGLQVPAGLSWDSQLRVNSTQRELWLTGPGLTHSTGWKGQTGWVQLLHVFFWFMLLQLMIPHLNIEIKVLCFCF